MAILRLALNFEQKEFAPLVGCSVETLKSVELGRLKLSEKLAEKVYLATGVEWSWLLNNDLNAPIIDDEGRPYSKEVSYRGAQTRSKKLTDNERSNLEAISGFLLADILAALSAAHKTSQATARVADHKFYQFHHEFSQQFGIDRSVLEGRESRTRYRVFEELARSLKATEKRLHKNAQPR